MAQKSKKIVLTGGGTAGHVTPNIALIDSLKEEDFDIHYIGSYNGIEKDLIEDIGIPYYGISSGKLRRYFDVKNFTDPFKVIKGCYEARKIMGKLKPDVVFSKGGFVTVPVIIASFFKRVPSIIHESDMTPGLANRLSIPFASKVCATFPETLKHLPESKGILTGTPIRRELMDGNKEKGLKICSFTKDKPILMMIGGSLGASTINKVIRESLDELMKKYQLVHLCGKGNYDKSLDQVRGYKQFEYVKEDLPHLFAMTDLVISRAGANSISELLALKKPNILIPLPLSQSRGDQILNAKSFRKHGYSTILMEENMTKDSLISTVNEVFTNKQSTISIMESSKSSDGIKNIINIITEITG